MSSTTTTGLTVGTALERYLIWAEDKYKRNTMKELERWLPLVIGMETLAGFRLADIDYEELRPSHLKAAFHTFASTLGKEHSNGERVLPSPNTIRNVIAYCGMFLRTMETATGQDRANPMLGVDRREFIGRLKPRRERTFLTDEQIDLLISEVRPHYRNLVTLIAYTGLRSGEARGLRWADVDLENQIISVSMGATQDGKEIVLLKTESSIRTVPLIGKALDVIREQYAIKGTSQFVFPTRNDTMISGHNLWKRVSEAAKAAGLPRCGVHDLRHSSLNNLGMAGAVVNVVSGIAGHSSTVTTQRFYYTNDVPDEEKLKAMRLRITPPAEAD